MFGENTKENELEVWQSPKYGEAKNKAVELINSEKYKGILLESDFWILMNKTKTNKMAYTGLIISHDGCLKINDTLDEQLKFKPQCVSIDKEGYGGSLVYTYCCAEQGLYEVGEVSANNCKNGYPYAMAFKRCFDRVVLKNSKIAYAGIYSDSEADDFKEPIDERAESKDLTEDNKKETEQKKATESKKTSDSKKDSTSRSAARITSNQMKIIKEAFGDEKVLNGWLAKHSLPKIDELSYEQAKNLIETIKEKKEKSSC